MMKTKKEQKQLEESSIKDTDSSGLLIKFFDKIKAINYFRHWKYIIRILLLSILLFGYIYCITFCSVIKSEL